MSHALADLAKMAQKLRAWSIKMTTASKSGHPTTCMSCAEAMSVLFFDEMKWDPSDPEAQNVDTFVLSKGHAAPILWATLYEAGAITEDPLTLRQFDSTLEGHPTFRNPWSRVATGSLGQGICAAVGVAMARRVQGSDARCYCLLGDGECAEGSVWEAAQVASQYGLDNLCCLVDVNRLGQSGPTIVQHDMDLYKRRFEAFGMHAVVCDGHDVGALKAALAEAAATKGRPTAVLLKTFKGRGVASLEDQEGKHGKPIGADQLGDVLAELGDTDVTLQVAERRHEGGAPACAAVTLTPDYEIGETVATRKAYGTALAKLGEASTAVVALDAEVRGSTNANTFAGKFPERFFEGYIAEQNMAGAAMGLGIAGMVPFASTFACFWTRAYDFLRMAVLTAPKHLVVVGSHGGVSVGPDGPSQMGLEDIAMMRALATSTVLYPCDAVSTEKLVEAAHNTTGIVYLRTSRPGTPVIYKNDETFPVGGSKLVRSGDNDSITIVAAGVTVHEALKAADALATTGVQARIVDVYSVKPLDRAGVLAAALATGKVLTVEDHSPCGGIGEAVAAVVAAEGIRCKIVGIDGVARSASGSELMAQFGIDAAGIEKAAKEMLA